MPKTTIQVLPAVAHPVNASGFLMADDAAWVEHAAGGFVSGAVRRIACPCGSGLGQRLTGRRGGAPGGREGSGQPG